MLKGSHPFVSVDLYWYRNLYSPRSSYSPFSKGAEEFAVNDTLEEMGLLEVCQSDQLQLNAHLCESKVFCLVPLGRRVGSTN